MPHKFQCCLLATITISAAASQLAAAAAACGTCCVLIGPLSPAPFRVLFFANAHHARSFDTITFHFCTPMQPPPPSCETYYCCDARGFDTDPCCSEICEVSSLSIACKVGLCILRCTVVPHRVLPEATCSHPSELNLQSPPPPPPPPPRTPSESPSPLEMSPPPPPAPSALAEPGKLASCCHVCLSWPAALPDHAGLVSSPATHGSLNLFLQDPRPSRQPFNRSTCRLQVGVPRAWCPASLPPAQ